MKKILFVFHLFIVFFSLAACTSKDTNKAVSNPLTHSTTMKEATIFIHGSGGNETDLVPFSEALEKDGAPIDGHLFVRTDKNNNITFVNALTKDTKHIGIFIGYENANAEVSEWKKGLKKLLTILYKETNIKKINLVGFSNGGLVAADMIKQPNHATELTIQKIVAIGAPFNDLEPINNKQTLNFSDTRSLTDYYQQFVLKKDYLENTALLSIAGNVSDDSLSDTVVPVTSALASRLLYNNHIKYYEEQIAKGETAEHTGLVSKNREVPKWVNTFLFKSNNKELKGSHLIETK